MDYVKRICQASKYDHTCSLIMYNIVWLVSLNQVLQCVWIVYRCFISNVLFCTCVTSFTLMGFLVWATYPTMPMSRGKTISESGGTTQSSSSEFSLMLKRTCSQLSDAISLSVHEQATPVGVDQSADPLQNLKHHLLHIDRSPACL